MGGTIGKLNYYSFGQYKRGDGWRENSGFEQFTGYLDLHYQLNRKTRVGIELTRMHYLAQQPGGLVDFEFQRDPRQSIRDRNWFQVNWALTAFHFDYELSGQTKLNIRSFLLDARREALGDLRPINRPDPGRERDLIDGQYFNLGQEARLLHQYSLPKIEESALVVGYRLYRGSTQNRQGLADDGSGPSFQFLNPDRLEGSNYDIPSQNVAVFAENLLRINTEWALTPGLRYEYIRTASDGYFRRLITAGREVLLDELIEDQQSFARSFLLAGLGVSYRHRESREWYGNISQNYRAINFTDLVVINPNLLIDSTLSDERGFNAELGWRGNSAKGWWRFDVSAFYMRYANRIGLKEVVVSDPIAIERLVTMRSNIGAANLMGLECFAELDLLPLLGHAQSALSIRPFLNGSLIHGRYVSGGTAIEGKAVELVPPLSLKTGLTRAWKSLGAQILYSYVGDQFSDATNATLVPDATRGLIPAYQVWDLSMSYQWRKWRLQAGINNLADARYFARRANGYPGPGILPSEARSFYTGLRLTL